MIRCGVIWLYLYNLDKFKQFFNELSKRYDLTIYYEIGDNIDYNDFPLIKFVQVKQVTYPPILCVLERIYNHYKAMKDNVDFILIFSKGMHEIITFCLKYMIRVPIILRLRGNHLREFEKRKANIIKRFFVRKGLRFIWSKFDLIIPISDKLKDEYREKYNLNNLTESIYNGIESSLFDDNKTNGRKTVFGYLGRMMPEKNPETLIKIFNECKNIKFIVASKNEGNYKFPENVEYVGWINRKRLSKEVYNKCDYILIPSDYETQCMVVLEAYLTNTSIIINRLALPYDIFIHGYIMNHNIDEWIKLIKKIHRENIKVDSNVREIIMKQFDWVICVDKFQKLINDKLIEVK